MGVPYSWGGEDTPEEFVRKVGERWPAGHVPNGRESRRSQHTAGVDCSGLVSRSWRLPRKVSTGELAAVSVKLTDARDLLPGDVLNKSNGPVLLFATFTDATRTRARVIEAGAWDGRAWKVVESEYALEALAATPRKRREMTR